jgi:large subunit ribosomal protein L22
MEVRAVAKNVRVSPRKLRPLVNVVRGKPIDEALTILRFASTPRAKVIAKLVKSAAANAENNFEISSNMKIVRIFVDGSQTMKRYRPRARGRASSILKRSSHITVVIAEEEEKVGA